MCVCGGGLLFLSPPSQQRGDCANYRLCFLRVHPVNVVCVSSRSACVVQRCEYVCNAHRDSALHGRAVQHQAAAPEDGERRDQQHPE